MKALGARGARRRNIAPNTGPAGHGLGNHVCTPFGVVNPIGVIRAMAMLGLPGPGTLPEGGSRSGTCKEHVALSWGVTTPKHRTFRSKSSP